MLPIFNQYSFVIGAVAGGMILGVMLWRWRRVHAAIRGALLALYLVGVIGFILASRFPSETRFKSVSDVEAVLKNGQPTFMMLYSNY